MSREDYDMPSDKVTVEYLADCLQNYYDQQYVRVVFRGTEYWVEDVDEKDATLYIGSEVKRLDFSWKDPRSMSNDELIIEYLKLKAIIGELK